MPTRDSYAQDPSAGDVLTAANFRKLPGGWVGYAEGTSDVTGITTTATDVTGTSLTLTPDSSRRLLLIGQIFVEATTAPARADVFIAQDGSQVGVQASVRLEATGTNNRQTLQIMAVITPTNASHTYILKASAVTGTIAVRGASQASILYVADVGPAS